MTTNKRKVGDNLEDFVIKKLGSKFHKTGNSGATFKDGDIRHSRLVIECKVKNGTKGFAAPIGELKKLWKLSDDQCKDWLYIEQNADGRVMVLLEIDTLLTMMSVPNEYIQ